MNQGMCCALDGLAPLVLFLSLDKMGCLHSSQGEEESLDLYVNAQQDTSASMICTRI